MKEKINNIVFIVSVGMILILSLLFIVKKPTIFSENENRYLTMFPKLSFDSLAGGKLTGDIEDYINDQFPFRDTLVGIKTGVEVLLGKTKINDVYITSDGYLIPTFSMNNDYTKIINTLNNFVGSVDADVSLMLAPNAIDIYPEKLPVNDELNNGLKEIERIYSNFNSKTININSSLLNIKNEVDLYYRTDHHWTTYGAYFAYQEYLKQTSGANVNLSDYNIKRTEGFYGTSYSKSNYYAIEPDDLYLFEDNVDYKVNYVVENVESDSLYNYDYLEKKDKYSVFLDNNHALIEIDNLDNENGVNMLLIKNSYGNSFAPFIAKDYDKLSVIDLRYYKNSVSDYIKENNIEKVLILYDINGIYTDASIYKLR
ncbi:MAG: hypothetical protein IJO63_04665 [Bacilli bacterium]|nr:hypothetical protein [Bacilli bacterium]